MRRRHPPEFSKAMTNLGVLYEDGHGVPQDYQTAKKWFEKAAAAGDAEAMYMLRHLGFKRCLRSLLRSNRVVSICMAGWKASSASDSRLGTTAGRPTAYAGLLRIG